MYYFVRNQCIGLVRLAMTVYLMLLALHVELLCCVLLALCRSVRGLCPSDTNNLSHFLFVTF